MIPTLRYGRGFLATVNIKQTPAILPGSFAMVVEFCLAFSNGFMQPVYLLARKP
jgi:hypothetical protein